jgi:hypothetical protein
MIHSPFAVYANLREPPDRGSCTQIAMDYAGRGRSDFRLRRAFFLGEPLKCRDADLAKHFVLNRWSEALTSLLCGPGPSGERFAFVMSDRIGSFLVSARTCSSTRYPRFGRPTFRIPRRQRRLDDRAGVPALSAFSTSHKVSAWQTTD